MAVRLRLKRFGRRNHPTYRLAAIERRNARDGKVLEELGHYDPRNKDASRQVDLKKERIEYWLSVGATPSDTVRELLKKDGITLSASGT
jgi:small subunit ribosomal protein S16